MTGCLYHMNPYRRTYLVLQREGGAGSLAQVSAEEEGIYLPVESYKASDSRMAGTCICLVVYMYYPTVQPNMVYKKHNLYILKWFSSFSIGQL